MAQPRSTDFQACRLIGVHSDVVVVVDGFRAQRMCDLFAEDEGFPGRPMAAVASGGEALRWEPPRGWVERCAGAAPGADGASLCRVLRTSVFG